VTLTGRLVVANANTIYANQPPSTGISSLMVFAAFSGTPAASAIATSNILNGDPQNIGFSTFVAANNIAL
jgi:hypothetical protein